MSNFLVGYFASLFVIWLVVADYVSKLLVVKNKLPHDLNSLGPGWIQYFRFSFDQKLYFFNLLIVGVLITALLIVSIEFYKQEKSQMIKATVVVIVTFFIAGFISNAIDCFDGKAIDFIRISSVASMNIADLYVLISLIGFLGIVIYCYFIEPQKNKNLKTQQ